MPAHHPLRLSTTPDFSEAIGKAVERGSASTLATLRQFNAVPVTLLPQLLSRVMTAVVRGHAEVIGQLRAAGWQLHGDSIERKLLPAVAKAISSGQGEMIQVLAKGGFRFASHMRALSQALAQAVRGGEAGVITALNTARPRPSYQQILPALRSSIVAAAEEGDGDVLRELRFGGLLLPEGLRQEAEEAAVGKGSPDAAEELGRGRLRVTTEHKEALAAKALGAGGRRQETRFADLRASVIAANHGAHYVPRNYR